MHRRPGEGHGLPAPGLLAARAWRAPTAQAPCPCQQATPGCCRCRCWRWRWRAGHRCEAGHCQGQGSAGRAQGLGRQGPGCTWRPGWRRCGTGQRRGAGSTSRPAHLCRASAAGTAARPFRAEVLPAPGTGTQHCLDVPGPEHVAARYARGALEPSMEAMPHCATHLAGEKIDVSTA